MVKVELFFVYALDQNGYVKGEKRVTDKAHLEECVKNIKNDFGCALAHYNKAEMCFNGYLVQGEYLGTL